MVAEVLGGGGGTWKVAHLLLVLSVWKAWVCGRSDAGFVGLSSEFYGVMP